MPEVGVFVAEFDVDDDDEDEDNVNAFRATATYPLGHEKRPDSLLLSLQVIEAQPGPAQVNT